MGLIKQRPKISLFAPSVVYTGRGFGLRARLDCPATLEVNAVTVELVGLEVYFTQSQYGQHRGESVFCRATKDVCGQGELGAGGHEFDVEFAIPDQFASSYVGKHIRVEWEARVHVDIPWWPDARASFNLHVSPSRASELPSGQRIWSSRPEGPLPGKPHLELSVGSTEVEPGGVMTGAVALANTDEVDYRAMEFRLMAVERLNAGLLENSMRVTRARWQIELDEPGEGESTEFRLRLPDDMAPAFDLHRIGLQWWVQVTADVPWTVDPCVWVPLTVRPRSVALGELAPAPLAVGTERIELVWQKVGEELGFNYVDGALRRGVGHTQLEIRREHDPKRGGIVVADVDYPDLGIDLRWDSKRGFSARDEGQAKVLRDCLTVEAGKRLHAEADDDRLSLVLVDTGRSVEKLRDFASEVHRIGRALEAARLELPAPTVVEDEVPLWQRVARGVGGSFSTPAVEIRGSRDEMRFRLGLGWKPSGEPDVYELEVEAPMPIDSRHHVEWSVGDPPLPAEHEAAELAERANRVVIDRRRIRVFLDRGGGKVDVAAAVLERALGVGRALTGGVGPYR